MKKSLFTILLVFCTLLGITSMSALAASPAADSVYHTSIEAAGEQLREAMKAHENPITIYYQLPKDEYENSTVFPEQAIADEAVKHTGIPNEGDYLKFSYLFLNSSVIPSESDGICYLEIVYSPLYFATAEQEAQVGPAVKALLDQLNVYNASDYEKVRAVYDWICMNVRYDNNFSNYSAYHALISRSSTCQGYATLFYRLMLELGVDCRYFGGDTGNEWGQLNPHGWNLVCVDGNYYQVDTTWGAGLINGEPDYYYLLKGADGMADHLVYQSRWDEEIGDYCTIAAEDHPIPEDKIVLISGRCNDNINFSLSKSGVLTISGTGELGSSRNWPDWNVYEYERYIKEAVVGEGITSIATHGVPSYYLVRLWLPDSLTSIAEEGAYAIRFEIPKNLSYIHPTSFSTSPLCKISVDPQNPYFTVSDNCLFSKDMKTLVRYCSTVDYNGLLRSEYYIPDGVENVGDYSFTHQRSLKKITFSNTVKNIGSYAFTQAGWANTKIEADLIVELTDSIVSIADNAFFECPSIRSLYIGKNVEHIGKCALGAHYLSDIQLHPENNYFTKLEDVLYSKDLTVLVRYPAPKKDTHYTIPEGVVEIYDGAFLGFVSEKLTNANLQTVSFPESLRRIGDFAFQNQSNLIELALPSRLEYIGEQAFYDAGKISTIIIPDSVKYIGEAAFYFNTADTIIIGSGIEEIGGAAFASRGRPDPNKDVSISVFFNSSPPPVDISSNYYAFGFAGFFESQGLCLYYPTEYISQWAPNGENRWLPDKNQQYVYFNISPYHYVKDGSFHPCQLQTKDIVCSEPGRISCSCNECGNVIYSSGSFECRWGEWEITVWPGEYSAGEEQRVCGICGNIEKREIPPTGHIHVPTPGGTVAPTCDKDGYDYTICATCHEYIKEPIPATGHKWDSGSRVEPGCESEGCTLYTCSACGQTKKESILPALEHKWDEGRITKEPSEENEGVKTFTCNLCGKTKTETIAKLEHTHNYDAVVSAPSCTEDGYTTHSCPCGDSYTDNPLPATGHKWDGGSTVAPGCTSEGYTLFTCGICAETKKESILPPTDHSWDSGKISKVPTTALEGEKTFTCLNCSLTKTEVIEKLAEIPFTDIKESDFFFEPVIWAMSSKVTSGVSANSFAPAKGCTRAQVVTFLWRAAGEPAPTGNNNPFTDVIEGQYYYDAVLWAVENGITTGISATAFGTNTDCNRGQIVTFLWRAMGKPTPESSENPFKDVAEVQYYYDAVLWAVEKGITTGISADSFGPASTCTRGQIVTFLHRTYQ